MLPETPRSGRQLPLCPNNYAYPQNAAAPSVLNGEEWPYRNDDTVLSLFKKQVEERPQQPAVIGTTTLTYAELEKHANQVAHYLLDAGVKPGDLVPVWIDRSTEWLVAVIGVLKTGAAYVPIDPLHPLKRVQAILQHTQAKVALASSGNSRLLQQCNIRFLAFDGMDDAAGFPAAAPGIVIAPASVAYVTYTSGSTGTPKGVVVRHLPVQHLVSWHNRKFGVNSNDRMTLVAGIAFDISVWEIWSALTAGATLVIAANEDRLDAASLLHFYVKHGITHGFVPTVLAPEVVELSKQQPGARLRLLFTGGEKLRPVNTEGLPYDFYDYYGPTEYTIFATLHKVSGAEKGYESIGRPIANTTVAILDSQLQPVPAGAAGELHLGGIGLAAEYYRAPELTAARFISHPSFAGERLYKTGDLAAMLPDGNIRFLGRIDNQVKIRGFRIELSEIEAVLMQQEGIKNAVAVVTEHKGYDRSIAAFVVPAGAAAEGLPGRLRASLKEQLPGYMVPAQFIALEKLPLTANGKTDFAALQQISAGFRENDVPLEPPATALEETIAGIWGRVLNRKAINRTDDFFDIGGSSIRVAPVATALARLLGIKVYLRDLYQFPVLKDLAAAIAERQAQATDNDSEEDVETVVELQRDVYLKPGTVIRKDFDPAVLANPAAVLLTGVTGFVGIHLLKDLLSQSAAKVYCLVRADNGYFAMERISQCLKEYHITIDREEAKRIVPVTGDFSKGNLGLSPEKYRELAAVIDVIYHSGSHVNFIEPYSYMKTANVDGLREIIAFAAEIKTKCLALLSTISVYSWGHWYTHKTVMKESDDIHQNLLSVSKDIGYVRSKWVMEAIADLAASEGLPVITYRLGYAMCHSRSGASAPYQWWAGLVKNCFEFGYYPDLRELREGLITVDYMTSAIAHISKNRDAIGLKFNLIARPETNLTLQQFFGLLNRYFDAGLQPLPYLEWRRIWEDDPANRLYALTSLFKDNMHQGLSTVELYQDTYIWDCENVTRFLQGSGIEEPVFDEALLGRYLRYLGVMAHAEAGEKVS